MTNFDVTPVGRPPGAGPAGPPAGRSDASDPFGSRPSVRRRGWVRIVLGVAAMVAGVVGTVWGIVDAVDTRAAIESEAVARGTVRATDGTQGAPVSFESPPGGVTEYSVYLIFAKGNTVNRESEEDAARRDTGCRADLPNERQVTFSGAGQGTVTTVGRATTLGKFSSPPGGVQVRCSYGPGDFRSRVRRPDRVTYVVTPSDSAELGPAVGLIVGGAFLSVGGGFMFAWGWRGRRRLV